MKLLDNWKLVVKRAWSIRLIVFAAILSGVEIALPVIDQLVEIPRGWFAAGSFIVTVAAFIARLVAQSNLPE